MTKPMPALASLAALCASTVVVAASAQPLLGDLPAGAVSSFEVSDVRTEICRTLLFPADAMPEAMPNGYRLAKLSEKTAPAIVELLRARPELGDYARGAFCFIDAGVHKIDGVSVYPGRRSKTAFLWADVVAAEGTPTDTRYRGAPRRAQLFWIYNDDGLDKKLARKVIPNALFGRIGIQKTGNSWFASVKTKQGKLAVQATPTTARVPLIHPLPAFETVPLMGEANDQFLVVTYAGHHEQRAVSHWRAIGSAPWVRTVASAVTTKDADFIQDSFSVNIGLYTPSGSSVLPLRASTTLPTQP